jgi:hypothetical protein
MNDKLREYIDAAIIGAISAVAFAIFLSVLIIIFFSTVYIGILVLQ